MVILFSLLFFRPISVTWNVENTAAGRMHNAYVLNEGVILIQRLYGPLWI